MNQTARVMTGEERILAACQHQPADATPIWFMRQAGRCLAGYRALRERYDIFTIAKTPELCAQVTLMPVNELGVDAAVMFADIMLPIEAMGVALSIEPDLGPVIHAPIRTRADVEKLQLLNPDEATPFVMDAIRLLRQELAGRAALVGFSGAPFTLACYLVEGRPSRDFALARAMMFREPELWHLLMDTLTEMVVRYLGAQAKAGAQVLQVFDSWVGTLAPATYERFVLPYSRRVFDEMHALGVPTIHFGTVTSSLLELMAEAGGDVISVDWRTPLDQAWERVGYDRGIQGNLDPATVLGSTETMREAAQDVLKKAGGRPGHIFNLGHGVLPETNPAMLAELVTMVHESTAR